MSLYPALHNPQVRAPKWWLVNAHGHRVGRLATQLVKLLSGKYKPSYNPSADCGDYVVLINARHVVFSGKKMETKYYRWHTGWIGGLKQRKAKDMFEKKPTEVMRLAVKRMLPKNKLGLHFLSRFLIYPDDTHPHQDEHLEQYLPDQTTPVCRYSHYDPKYHSKVLFSLEKTEDGTCTLQGGITRPKATRKEILAAKRSGYYGGGITRAPKESPIPNMSLLGPALSSQEWAHVRKLIKEGYDGKDWPVPPNTSTNILNYTKAALAKLEHIKSNPLPAPYPVSSYLNAEEIDEVLKNKKTSG
ncbi:uncharacterized protein LOC126323749 [Schistocerca gregaria]|uniref:uncharacterized protein LOC126323749 n=1 Tax=Schistocerca gregaria TaxID=7010 RepID=UPI00211E3019|nr:uncharacterized protein LOC126323749 [Schistocerca gregaria]